MLIYINLKIEIFIIQILGCYVKLSRMVKTVLSVKRILFETGDAISNMRQTMSIHSMFTSCHSAI